MRKFLFAAIAAAAACNVHAVDLFNNGTVINQAPNLSVLPAANGTLGVSAAAAGTFSLADDFTVGSAGWSVNGLAFFAYQTNATTFPYTNVAWSIVSGLPGVGTVVASGSTVPTSGGINSYRVTSTTLTSTARAVYEIDVATPTINLTAGTYWVTWSLTGNAALAGPFVPPTIAASGNSMQGTAGAYVPITDGTSFATLEMPFIIRGSVSAVPEPASAALLALGALGVFGLARRRAAR